MASLEFLQSLRENDLIRVNGRLRLIRAVHWRQWKGMTPTGYFTFAIARCSWTKRCTTSQKSTDFYHRTVELVARNYQPKGEFEANITAHARDKNLNSLHCCDVIGKTV